MIGGIWINYIFFRLPISNFLQISYRKSFSTSIWNNMKLTNKKKNTLKWHSKLKFIFILNTIYLQMIGKKMIDNIIYMPNFTSF